MSGIGDDIEEGELQVTADEELIEDQLEEGDLPTLEEGDLVESKASDVEQSPPSKSRSSSSSKSRSSSSSSSSEDDEIDGKSSRIEKPEDATLSTIENLEKHIAHLEDELQK